MSHTRGCWSCLTLAEQHAPCPKRVASSTTNPRTISKARFEIPIGFWLNQWSASSASSANSPPSWNPSETLYSWQREAFACHHLLGKTPPNSHSYFTVREGMLNVNLSEPTRRSFHRFHNAGKEVETRAVPFCHGSRDQTCQKGNKISWVKVTSDVSRSQRSMLAKTDDTSNSLRCTWTLRGEAPPEACYRCCFWRFRLPSDGEIISPEESKQDWNSSDGFAYDEAIQFPVWRLRYYWRWENCRCVVDYLGTVSAADCGSDTNNVKTHW